MGNVGSSMLLCERAGERERYVHCWRVQVQWLRTVQGAPNRVQDSNETIQEGRKIAVSSRTLRHVLQQTKRTCQRVHDAPSR